MKRTILVLAAACVTLFASGPPARAQVFTGRVDVTVSDSTGAVLPGVTVDITGPQNRTSTTDAKGTAVFLALPPGRYAVRASLAGFAEYRNSDVDVAAGVSVPLKIVLAVGGVEQQVNVVSESPTIDPKKLTTSTNVRLAELQEIPSSRDPWVVLQTVPGVIVDRVNVGGAESGQQSNYQSKGAASGENTWNMDGVPITDMSALGSSPTYYDFDMFQEMQVTTGGADLANPTPGVALNFVLKGGSNTPHGSTRIYYEDESLQANNLPDDLRDTLGGATGKGNRINKYADFGFELGGPVVRDRLWAWGALGKTDVTLLTLANTPDQTILKNSSFKANGQVTQDLRASYTFFRGDKQKFGRDASVSRPPDTTWNQSGPTSLHKGEANVVLRDNVFLTGRYSYISGGFLLEPQGGLDRQMMRNDSRIWQNTYYEYETVRPQWNAAAEGNVFRGRHEIKFGFGWRRADVDSTSTVPGTGIITYHSGYPTMFASVTAWNHNVSTSATYSHAYVGDTLTWDRLTLNAGIRWDRQAAASNVLSQAGNPVLPDLMPDLTGAAVNDVVVWNSVTPRIGLSYAVDQDRRTLVRASYGMFASQLDADTGGILSAVQARSLYFYGIVDANGNRIADPEELGSATRRRPFGFDINNPTDLTPINSVADYDTPLTHELQFGIDRELMRDFGVSATVTWRRFTNFTWLNNGLRASDYEPIDTIEGSHPAIGAYSVPVYGAIEGRVPENVAALIYAKRDGYHQRFWGVELSATKRLSNRWMGRVGFSVNDHREYFDGPQAMTDPTRLLGSPNIDGGQVMRSSGGSGKSGIYQVLPKYQFVANGLYQARWGINLAASAVTRQGFAMPYHLLDHATDDPVAATKSILLVDSVTDFRLPTVTSMDVRVGKEFTVQRYRFSVDLDVFNLLNSSTVLGRRYDLSSDDADTVLEIMNPRILRAGLRFSF